VTSGGSAIKFWDPISGHQVGEDLGNVGASAAGLAISADGRTLIAGGSDKALSFWDTESRQRLGEPLVVGQIVWSAAYAADRFVAAISWQSTSAAGPKPVVHIWDTDMASWQRQACRVANRNLTHREWDALVGSVRPYEKTCPDFP